MDVCGYFEVDSIAFELGFDRWIYPICRGSIMIKLVSVESNTVDNLSRNSMICTWSNMINNDSLLKTNQVGRANTHN